jgi:OTU domain-containing protein 6
MAPKTQAYYDKQKAKDKKKREKETELIRQEHAAVADPEVKRSAELAHVDAVLAERGMQRNDVAADGNCMFNAVAQQLQRVGRDIDGPGLRQLAVQYIIEHPERFQPFITGETVEEYVKRLSGSTEMWGGHIELMALANALRVRIEVVQEAPAHTVTPETADATAPQLTVVYLAHYMTLGAHYMGTVPSANNTS